MVKVYIHVHGQLHNKLFFCVSGSGLASVLVAQYQFTSTSIPSITSFSRLSKLGPGLTVNSC